MRRFKNTQGIETNDLCEQLLSYIVRGMNSCSKSKAKSKSKLNHIICNDGKIRHYTDDLVNIVLRSNLTI